MRRPGPATPALRAVLCGGVMICLVPLLSCGKDREKETQLRRQRDQAAVVVVDNSQESGKLVDEVEPNNEDAESQALGSADGVQGTLDGSTDVDSYSFDVSADGILFAMLDGAADADLKLELRDAQGTSLAQSDRGPAQTVEGLAGFPVASGSSYRFLVSEFTKKKQRKLGGRKGVSQPYRLRLRQRPTPEEGFEMEANEELAGAMEVAVDGQVFGYIGWGGDTDVWRLPVPGFGEVEAPSAELGGPPAAKAGLHIVVSGVTGVPTSLTLLASDGTVMAERVAHKGQEVAIRNFVPELAADFYQLRIGGKRSNPEESYVLRVEQAEIPAGTEEEPNDSVETATGIDGEAGALTVAHGEVSLGDTDVFSLASASENRLLELRLQGPADADLDVAVLGEDGAVLVASELEVVGASETLQAVNIAAGTAALVRVRARALVAPAPYTLTLTLVPGQAPVPMTQPVPGESVPVE